MATIKALKTKLEDGTEQVVFPKTLPEAIIDPETNKTLDVILDNLNEKIDNIEPGGGGGGTTYELSRTDDTITLSGGDGSSSEVSVSDKISNKRINITGQTIDLNSLTLADGTTDIALYINKTNAGSTNISNVPVGSTPFTLDVELIRWVSTTDYISKQVFICSSGKHQIRVRYCTSGTWGDWTTYDFTDVVSKSGDTMTGDLTVKANINTPLLSNNSDTTIVTVPTAGTVDIGSTDKGITDVLTSYKSFMGSIHTKDAWNNIISTRHRNGASDGVSHGMYLRSLMNRSTPDLMWAVQAAGTWQSERAILDSGNYSNYAVPKTGGTFTGDVTFNNAIIGNSEYNVLSHDYYVFHTADGAGKEGYWKLCTINVTGTYAGAIIEFDMTSRYGTGKLYVSFTGSTDVSAYDVGVFKPTDGINACYIIKTSGTSSGSVFEIYVKKEEAWGNLTVNHLKFPKYMRDLITLTWSGKYVSLPPSGFQGAGNAITLDSGNYSTYALPKAGGTLTGAVKYGSYNMLEYNSTSTTVSNTNRPNMYFGNDNTRTVLRGQVYINHPGVAPCTQIAWAVLSDARLKENIIDLTSTDDIKSKYIQLWDKVNPMEYNLTCNSNKKNLGYVAQDFIEAMEELGIDYEESSIVNIQPNEQIGEDGICSVSENSEYFEELYTLNYDECAMLTTLKVKQIVNEILPNMQAEIDALKEQNELLKEQIRLMKEGN